MPVSLKVAFVTRVHKIIIDLLNFDINQLAMQISIKAPEGMRFCKLLIEIQSILKKENLQTQFICMKLNQVAL